MSGDSQSPKGREIPAVKRVILNDVSQLPTDYSTTPGGTFFSTTPGGTRIVYDRSRLLQLRSSPLAKSPPANMAKIAGITDFQCPPDSGVKDKENGAANKVEEDSKHGHEEQFEMDI